MVSFYGGTASDYSGSKEFFGLIQEFLREFQVIRFFYLC